MPLYEYQCDACGFRFEVIQRFSDAPVETCQSCGATVRKLLSSPAIHFKGSGWYITDYARKGTKGAAPESGAPVSAGSNGSSGPQSPPAAKGESGAAPAKTDTGAKEPTNSSSSR